MRETTAAGTGAPTNQGETESADDRDPGGGTAPAPDEAVAAEEGAETSDATAADEAAQAGPVAGDAAAVGRAPVLDDPGPSPETVTESLSADPPAARTQGPASPGAGFPDAGSPDAGSPDAGDAAPRDSARDSADGPWGVSPAPPPTSTFTRAPGMAPPPDQFHEPEPNRRLDPVVRIPAGAGPPSRPVSTPSRPVSAPPGPVSAPPGPVSAPPGPVSAPPGGGSPSAGGPGPVVSANASVSAPPRAPGRTSPGGIPSRPIGASPAGAAVGAARVGEAVRAARAAHTAPRGPRRARLGLKRVDPWSVMKFSFAVSLVMCIVVIVAASVLYLALDTMGVFDSVNNTLAELVESGGGEGGGGGFRITAEGVIWTAGVLGALNVLLFTSLATLGAFVYNVCADLVGGVEVTLAERD